MEETKTPEPKSNYVELSDDSHNVGNIFNELSGELGELSFGELDLDKKKSESENRKKHPLEIAYSVSIYFFIAGIVAAIVLSLDVFVRASEDNEFFANLPICSYLSYGVEDYENEECKTVPMISKDADEAKEKLEKNIATNLVLLVPKFMQSLDIANSPKVQFIQEHTGDSRVSIGDVINRFIEIKNKTSYQGEDIECKTLMADEKGKLSLSCQVYGGALIAPAGLTTKTSRETTLAFLSRLSDPKSGFQITAYPKSLDISQFSTADGFRAVFSTKTTLELKLQYLPTNKM